jgi:hypothetical protein
MKRKTRKGISLGSKFFSGNNLLKHPPNYYLGNKKPGMILLEVLKKILSDLREKFFQKAVS